MFSVACYFEVISEAWMVTVQTYRNVALLSVFEWQKGLDGLTIELVLLY